MKVNTLNEVLNEAGELRYLAQHLPHEKHSIFKMQAFKLINSVRSGA